MDRATAGGGAAGPGRSTVSSGSSTSWSDSATISGTGAGAGGQGDAIPRRERQMLGADLIQFFLLNGPGEATPGDFTKAAIVKDRDG